MRGQALRDADLHRDIFRLIEKLDERGDREHIERLALANDLRTLVANVASDVRVIVTKLAIAGTVLVVAANIGGPLLVKLWP